MLKRPHHLVALPSLAVVSGALVKRFLAARFHAGAIPKDDLAVADLLADVWIGLSLGVLILVVVRIAWHAFRDGTIPPHDAQDS